MSVHKLCFSDTQSLPSETIQSVDNCSSNCQNFTVPVLPLKNDQSFLCMFCSTCFISYVPFFQFVVTFVKITMPVSTNINVLQV